MLFGITGVFIIFYTENMRLKSKILPLIHSVEWFVTLSELFGNHTCQILFTCATHICMVDSECTSLHIFAGWYRSWASRKLASAIWSLLALSSMRGLPMDITWLFIQIITTGGLTEINWSIRACLEIKKYYINYIYNINIDIFISNKVKII